jgi:signal transduction histidine kinase
LVRRGWWLLAGGLIGAALVQAAGQAAVAWRFGDPAAVLQTFEADVRQSFKRSADDLQRLAAGVAAAPEVWRGLDRPGDASRSVFDAIARSQRAAGQDESAVTVFDLRGRAVAWGGRPSQIPIERLQEGRALFVAQGALGLRLIAIEPVVTQGGTSRRVGTIGAELRLSRIDTAGTGNPVVETSLGPVTLQRTFDDRAVEQPGQFVLRGPSGEPLLLATLPARAPEETRSRWQRRVTTAALLAGGATVLLLAATVAVARRTARNVARFARLTLVSLVLLGCVRALLWWAVPPDTLATASVRSWAVYASSLLPGLHRSPLDLMVTGLTLLAAVLVLVGPVRASILAWRGRRRSFPGEAGESAQAVAAQLIAGVGLVALQVGVLAIVKDTAENTSVDLLRLTVLPWEPARLALLVGIVLLQAVALWVGVMVCRLGLSRWRPGAGAARWLLPAAWILPAAGAAAVLGPLFGLPWVPIVAMAVMAASLAWLTRRGVPWYRHGSQAARLGLLLLALVLPAWLVYPALVDSVDGATRQLVEDQYAVDVRSHPKELYSHLQEALRQIDAFPGLLDLVRAAGPSKAEPSTEAAFQVWRSTDLERFRLTSSIELYADNGSLLSRFALNFPESEVVPLQSQSRVCDWEIFGEALPFGADERRMLHAERALCLDNGRGGVAYAGSIVAHVMLDYSALEFISSQSPYFEFFRAARASRREGTVGGDVDLTIVGWGRSPLYSSSNQSWRLTDAVFERVYRSREPFWTTLERGDSLDRVFVSNDRNGIYVLGYPVLTPFMRLVHLGELTSLAVLLFVALMVLASLAQRILRQGPYPAAMLVGEIRSSFYRKLFIAFVAATVLPVLALAFLVRAYFANQLFRDVEAEAARTALTAKRIIEESLAFELRESATATTSLSDDIMVWLSRVIDQDVNIFDGPELRVTSERDLFASGLLPTRTPGAVYQAVAIERLATYVGQDRIGADEYLVAATPVRVGGRDAILTVPLASRQREIEREIDELDRGVLLGALVLICLGAGLGYWMAERIGDPVLRLTRATRRIAAGDLSVRVIVRTADELQRLVEAFNRMAGELQRQREQLERTHRLEAWAEMARQVAHDIKNPLTPIQLSAEHLRRVHRDRGAPLSPVLEGCVDSILTQVRLLRQIASEFSAFGTSPAARPAPTSIDELIREVVEPYRLGLDGRVTIETGVEPGLPPVPVDRMLVGRALTNVIENALHAMPGGGVLGIYARTEGRAVAITVTDTGVGMDDEAAARIFEPYFSTKTTGTGLGLSIARRNIELHGGSIAVESTKAVGTTVTIVLPFGPALPSATPEREPRSLLEDEPAPRA